MEIKCKRCKRRPENIPEYVYHADLNNMYPDEYVEQEEGTYNEETKEFYCTECYSETGMPLGKA